jgi:hypothetical protein
MPSPFPGMDPYLESPAVWSDFHAGMNVALRAELNTRLPKRYVARVDRYLWVQGPGTEQGTLLGKPDVYVAGPVQRKKTARQTAAQAAPATVVLPLARRQGNRYIKVFDVQDHRVVTVLELLSPANKVGRRYRRAYRAKRSEYLASGVNLVEIDLLRAGRRLPMGNPPPPPADYYILVCRASELPKAGVWPLSVRDQLPAIPIPLDPGEPDVLLPLRPSLDRAYHEARFESELDYKVPPDPPLPEPDATWARELLARRPSDTPNS